MLEFFKEKDKQKHILSHIIGVQGLILLSATPLEAAAFMAALGILYEIIFRNKEVKESFRDVLANTIGDSTAFIWMVV